MKTDSDGLLRQALVKQLAGDVLTTREAQAVKNFEKAEGFAARAEAYRAVPVKEYCRLAGRSAKVLERQAQACDLPELFEKTIDLSRALRQIHDALDGARAGDDLMVLGTGNSPNMERYRGHKADLAELEVEARRRELLPRDEVRDFLGLFASKIRGATETLEREYGDGARLILDQVLDELEEDVRRAYFGEATGAAEGSES